jgi:hypothetical protein
MQDVKATWPRHVRLSDWNRLAETVKEKHEPKMKWFAKLLGIHLAGCLSEYS